MSCWSVTPSRPVKHQSGSQSRFLQLGGARRWPQRRRRCRLLVWVVWVERRPGAPLRACCLRRGGGAFFRHSECWRWARRGSPFSASAAAASGAYRLLFHISLRRRCGPLHSLRGEWYPPSSSLHRWLPSRTPAVPHDAQCAGIGPPCVPRPRRGSPPALQSGPPTCPTSTAWGASSVFVSRTIMVPGFRSYHRMSLLCAPAGQSWPGCVPNQQSPLCWRGEGGERQPHRALRQERGSRSESRPRTGSIPGATHCPCRNCCCPLQAHRGAS